MNSGRYGFYRVHYSNDNAYAKLDAKLLSSFEQVDVLAIEEDAFALANIGIIPVSQFLALSNNLNFELSLPLFSSLTDNLKALIQLHGEESYIEKLKTFCSKAISRYIEKYDVRLFLQNFL